ncbi:GNAT family N-acetyltransferase [Rhodobacteraceae bacterium 2CG4]|uniref:GNAT family N-acetyltransferase n=1 Tax=Halovulum marinum TaxID=2662447 RepID=A0A6L5Z7H0_9RHOB|nr:N-acetyltransferase [Halovulum marinum]MSU92339.1 GNAT family N-acetyltransferase [Halovulum marinum]
MTQVRIRPETPADIDAIRDLTDTAFAPMAFSDGTEGACIARLRADGDLALSLVPETTPGQLVGHVAFSPASAGDDDEGWFGLGPVAVLPDRQRGGIGSALIRAGLDRSQASGARGCVLIGSPAYYRRFGFAADGRVSYRAIPTRNVMWLAFGDHRPAGEMKFSPGLE